MAQDAPLTEVLVAMTAAIEAQTDGMMASVLLLDAEGRHLSVAAARVCRRLTHKPSTESKSALASDRAVR